MSTVGSLVVNLLGNTQHFRTEFAAVPGVLRGVTSSILSLVGIGGGLATLGRGLTLSANAEQAAVSFEVLTGSVQKTRRIMSDLQAYADKSPYSLAGATEATRLLLNFGVTAENTMPTLKQLGDIAGGDEQKLHSLALAFGQSSSAGRLMGQDLNQMINAGFNPLVEISKRTGESMSALKSRMEAGGISTMEVTQAFSDATAEGGRFFGMTERQAGTVSGLFNTLRDTMDGVLRIIGQKLTDAFDIKAILTQSISFLQSWSSWIQQNARDVLVYAGVIVGFVSAFAAVRTAMFLAAQAAAIWQAVSNPVGLVTLAAGLFGALVAVQSLNEMFDASTAKMQTMSAAAGQTAASIDGITGAANGASALGEELEKLKAIRAELKQTNLTPNYRKNLEGKETASAARVDAMTSVPGGTQALSAVDALHAKIADLKAAGESGFEFKIQGIEDQIGKLSGASEKIQALRDQVYGVSQADSEANKLSMAGATNDQVAEFQQLSAEAEKLKKLRSSAAAIQDKTESPEEKFKKQLETIHALRQKGLIDEETFNRASDIAAKDMASSDKDAEKERLGQAKHDKPLEAIMRGSKESQTAILRGMQGGDKGPNAKLESLADKTLKAQTQATAYLAQLAKKESEDDVVVMDY